MVRKNLALGRQPAGKQTKVVEDGGISTHVGLIKANEFGRDNCLREECLLCFQMDGKRTQCDKKNICYQGQCSRCPEFTLVKQVKLPLQESNNTSIITNQLQQQNYLPSRSQPIGNRMVKVRPTDLLKDKKCPGSGFCHQKCPRIFMR